MGITRALVRFLANTDLGRAGASTPKDEQLYKAFISYSHAADGKLAPALQTGLHRFAKPWYRLRAMRVFRDETTLATSPELWPSIEAALRQSEYFVFLASPEAAQSYWVRREFEFWVSQRPKDRMLIVLTDGELFWDHAARDFDWTKTTALPQGIAHGFRDEPLYLDLRWAKTEEHLSLSNLIFRSAVADVASTLLGRAKDELIGEDVRRHLQTRRIAWSAVATLVVLTAASIIAAVIAVQNQREAQRQQRIAEERGAIALSRQLAAQAVSLAGSERGDLALLLSLEALDVRPVAPTVDARNGLLAALTRDPFRRFHLHGHMGEITSLAFSADDRELLSLGCEGIDTLGLCKHFGVRRWDVLSGEPKGQAMVPGTNRWSVLSRRANGETLVVSDRSFNEWDPVSGQSLGKAALPGLTNPRGDILAETTNRGLVLRRTDTRQRLETPLGQERETIRSVAFHPTAGLLVTGGSMGDLRLWDTNELLAGSQEPHRLFDPHEKAVTDLEFSPDGRYLVTVSADGSALAWDLETGTAPRLLVEGVSVSSVTFSQDNRWLLVALSIGERTGELQLWDARLWRLRETLAGQAPVAISRDGRLLAAAGTDGALILRDLEQDRPLGRTLEEPGDAQSLAFLDGGRLLIAGGRDQTLRLWDVESGRLERPPIPTQQGWVEALAAHPDGRHLASGGEDGSIFVWDLHNRDVQPPKAFVGHSGPVAALDFSRDGRQLVSGGFDKTLRIWETETGRPLLGSPIDTGQDVYVARFDRFASRVASATEDGSVLIWQLSDAGVTGSIVGTHLLQSDGMTGLSFGPQDRFLVSSSLEQTQFWGLEPGEPPVRAPIQGSFAALAPSGELAALVTDSQKIQLVDINTWRVFDATLGRQKDLIYAMVFSPDGRQLAAAAKGDMLLWDVDIANWRKRACAIARRNLTSGERERYLGKRPYAPSCPGVKHPPQIPLDAERALGLAVRAAKLGESVQAASLFSQAAQLAAAGDAAEVANRVCWFGAAYQAPANILTACERAVELDPDNGSYRDSRGLARAQLGDATGAIEDFRVYLSAVKPSGRSIAERRSRRQAWIEALQAGRNPFDSMELHRVRNEHGFR